MLHIPLMLSRHCFSPRDAARAGDIWRALQDAAVLGSSRCGWPPSRYRDEGTAFVVRSMTTVHHREARFGEEVHARTWISEFRRGLLIYRQIHLEGTDGPIASTTQEWAHVKLEGGRMRPARASEALVSSFAEEGGDPVELPSFEPAGGREHVFAFRCWWTWMDPLDHANHPAYVDWCDEALSRVMADAGLDPIALAPVAEHVKWRAGVEAPSEVVVRTRLVGRTPDGDVVCDHLFEADGAEAATARTVRRLTAGTESLALALA